MTQHQKTAQAVQSPRQLKYLMQSTLLEEARTPRWLLSSIVLVSMLLVGAIIWAYYTQINEISRAPGIIQPLAETEIIEHPEGGIVTHLYVKNGQFIEAKAPLLTINPSVAQSQLSKLHTQEVSLLFDQLRLQAFIEQTPLNREEMIHKVSKTSTVSELEINEMLNSTLALLNQQNQARTQALFALENKIAQQKQLLKNMSKSIQNRQNRLKILAKSKEIYEELDKTQDVSKVSMMNAIERYNETEGELLEILAEEQSAKNELQAIQQQIKSYDLQAKETAMQELNDVTSNLISVRKIITASQDKLERLTLTASKSGIINGLDVKVGSVIGAGSPILEIVPQEKEFVVEARIDAEDIGYVKVGDPVDVKLTSYNFVQYGHINGTIKNLSASTFIDSNQHHFYQAMIDLEKNHVGSNPKHQVIPGMTVEADIVTGRRSLLSFLLKPLHQSVDDAFQER